MNSIDQQKQAGLLLRFRDTLFRHPARAVGVLGALGDSAMSLSGVIFENFGRAASSLLGLSANLPLIFSSERKRKAEEIDPQDLPFREKIKHIWKFWKYPFEFGALANMTQTFCIMLFSGPDTVSAVGQQAHIPALVSQDQFRPFETILGVGGVVGSGIGLIREEKKNNQSGVAEVKGILPNLRRDWDAVAGFTQSRVKDLVSEGVRIDKGLGLAFENGCLEIACAGPNKVTAKIFNALLYPWAIESAFREDWANVASACIYRTGNYFYARSSKRTIEPV